jgi:hypothetical protein
MEIGRGGGADGSALQVGKGVVYRFTFVARVNMRQGCGSTIPSPGHTSQALLAA